MKLKGRRLRRLGRFRINKLYATVLICAISVGVIQYYTNIIQLPQPPGGPPPPALIYTAQISSSDAQNYGFHYPITYCFSLPQANEYAVWCKYDDTTWQRLPIKSSSDFFNGIEAARFDYTTLQLYVSVAFKGRTRLSIGMDGNNVEQIQFAGIAKYYDNRKATVMVNFDDARRRDQSQNDEWHRVLQLCVERKLWVSIGINTGSVPWSIYPEADWGWLQYWLNTGMVEAINHAHAHDTSGLGTDYEVGEAHRLLLQNLRHTWGQYIFGFNEPGGANGKWNTALASRYYLGHRNSERPFYGIAQWDSGLKMFLRYGLAAFMDDACESSLSVLNSRFNTAYGQGGVYQLSGHPYSTASYKMTLDGSYVEPHLNYISGKTDIWYTGFGLFYFYQYALRNGVISVVRG